MKEGELISGDVLTCHQACFPFFDRPNKRISVGDIIIVISKNDDATTLMTLLFDGEIIKWGKAWSSWKKFFFCVKRK